jgi:hypothetical protein
VQVVSPCTSFPKAKASEHPPPQHIQPHQYQLESSTTHHPPEPPTPPPSVHRVENYGPQNSSDDELSLKSDDLELLNCL